MKDNHNGQKSKVITVIGVIISAILFLSAALVCFSAFKAKKEGRSPTFFGYSFSIVATGSMEPEIPVGSLLIVKSAVIETVEVGDNIVFIALGGSVAGERVVHEVIVKGYDEQGLYFITKGKNNALPDVDKVRESNFVGKDAGHSVFLGKTVSLFMRIETLLCLAVIVIALFVAVKQIKKIHNLSKQKEDKSA